MSSIHQHDYPSSLWAVTRSNAMARSRFARNRTFPTARQIMDNLGATMSEVLFTNLTTEIKESPKLEGPKGAMWTPPEDRLMNIKRLVPVKNVRHIQAFTHQAIDEIGKKFEAIKEAKEKKQLEIALKIKEKEMADAMERKLTEVRNRTKCEFYELYTLRLTEVFNSLKKEFEEKLEERAKAIRLKVEAEKEEALLQMRKNLECDTNNLIKMMEESYNSKLNFEKEWDCNLYYNYYLEKLRFQKLKWSKLFNDSKLNCEHEKKIILKQASSCFKRILDCKMQKKKQVFTIALKNVIKCFYSHLQEMEKKIEELQIIIKSLEENEAMADKAAWECLLKDVITQFQKFINFFLKEIPGQDEYLLSLKEIIKTRVECFDKQKKGEHINFKLNEEASTMQFESLQFIDEEMVNDDMYERIANCLADEIHEVAEASASDIEKTVLKYIKELNEALKKPAPKVNLPELGTDDDIVSEEIEEKIITEERNEMDVVQTIASWMEEKPAEGEGRVIDKGSSTDSEIIQYWEEVSNPYYKLASKRGLIKNSKPETVTRTQITGADHIMKDDWRQFLDDRVKSTLNMFLAHPEIKNIVIKP